MSYDDPDQLRSARELRYMQAERRRKRAAAARDAGAAGSPATALAATKAELRADMHAEMRQGNPRVLAAMAKARAARAERRAAAKLACATDGAGAGGLENPRTLAGGGGPPNLRGSTGAPLPPLSPSHNFSSGTGAKKNAEDSGIPGHAEAVRTNRRPRVGAGGRLEVALEAVELVAEGVSVDDAAVAVARPMFMGERDRMNGEDGRPTVRAEPEMVKQADGTWLVR